MTHTTPRESFLRQPLSESLGRAPLCLCFLSRLTKKFLIFTECSLNQRFLGILEKICCGNEQRDSESLGFYCLSVFIPEFIKQTAKYTKDAKVDRAYSFHRKKQKISFSMPSLYSPYSCSKPVLVLLLRTLRSLPRLLFNLYSPDFLCSSVTLCHVLASLYLP